MRRLARLALGALLAASALGCGARRQPSGDGNALAAPPAQPKLTGRLSVLVPGGVLGPATEVLKLFGKQHRGLEISHEMNSIQVLTHRVVRGDGRADVWLTLGDREAKRALDAGKVTGKPITYAHVELGVVCAAGGGLGISRPEDVLTDGSLRVAVPSESNSLGYHFRRACRRLDAWEDLAKRVVTADEPYHAKQLVAEGKAAAGIVYYPCSRETDRAGGPPGKLDKRLRLIGRFGRETVSPISMQAVVLRGGTNAAAARALVRFLRTAEAQKVFRKWGFLSARAGAAVREPE